MDLKDAATHLEHDHRELAASLDRLVDFACACDEPLLREEWEELERRLLAHLDAEEMFLLPGFEREQPSDAAAIRKDHAEIRRRLGELGVAIDIRALRAEDVVELRERLAAHVEAEMQSLYPWTRVNAQSLAARALHRRLESLRGVDSVGASALRAVVEACRDGERGYRAAASAVHDGGYQLMFEHYADERAQFAAKLDAAARTLGVASAHGGSTLGTLHRGWIDTKAALTHGDSKAVLRECGRGEEEALRIYRSALHAELPPGVRELVQEQYEAIKKARAEVSALVSGEGHAA